MFPTADYRVSGRTLSDQKSHGTTTNRVRGTMGQLEVSPLVRSDMVNSTKNNPVYSPQ